VRAHPGQIDSIITNLLDNAIKYTPAEGSIHVSLFSNQTTAILRMEDSGSSLDAEEIEKVFQRFYRSPAHQQIIGSGLGLAIVKTALDQLHGRIILSQSDLGGLQVDVHLPASI
jgi:signal transduction histidine kinase